MERNLEPFEHINKSGREILIYFNLRYLCKNILFNFEQMWEKNFKLVCYSGMDMVTQKHGVSKRTSIEMRP